MLVLGIAYAIGVIVVGRIRALAIQDMIDRLKDGARPTVSISREIWSEEGNEWSPQWLSADRFSVILHALFWPLRLLRLLAFVTKRVLFPRGMKSKYARDKEKAQVQERQQAQLQELQELCRTFDLPSIEDALAADHKAFEDQPPHMTIKQ